MVRIELIAWVFIALVAIPSWSAAEEKGSIEVAPTTGTAGEELRERLVDVICGAAVESGYRIVRSQQTEPRDDEGAPQIGEVALRDDQPHRGFVVLSQLDDSEGDLTLVIELRSGGEITEYVKKTSVEAEDLFAATRSVVFHILGKEQPAMAVPAPPPLPPLPEPKLDTKPPPPPKLSPEEARALKIGYCATRKSAHLPAKVFGASVALPVALYLISSPLLYFAMLGALFTSMASDDDDEYNSESQKEEDERSKRVVMIVGGVFMGINSIGGPFVAREVGTDACWCVSWFPLFVGSLVGSAGSLIALWAYMDGDKRGDTGLGVLTFFVVPTILPAITQTVAYMMFRKHKFTRSELEEAKRSRKRTRYSPPSPTIMISHDGQRPVAGLSLGQLSF